MSRRRHNQLLREAGASKHLRLEVHNRGGRWGWFAWDMRNGVLAIGAMSRHELARYLGVAP
jgi:hypothetical protein